MNATTPVDAAKVRRLLTKAGLTAPQKSHSKNIKGGFTTVTSPGIEIKRQTEYKRIEDKAERRGFRKAHVPTGKVEVSYVPQAWVPESRKEEFGQRQVDAMALVATTLTEAGYTVTTDRTGVIVVSA
jgi:hypothetical protein